MPHCVGLLNDPCPYKAKCIGVFFTYTELDLCPHCERARREQGGVWVSENLIKETSKPQTDSANVAKLPGNHLNNLNKFENHIAKMMASLDSNIVQNMGLKQKWINYQHI